MRFMIVFQFEVNLRRGGYTRWSSGSSQVLTIWMTASNLQRSFYHNKCFTERENYLQKDWDKALECSGTLHTKNGQSEPSPNVWHLQLWHAGCQIFYVWRKSVSTAFRGKNPSFEKPRWFFLWISVQSGHVDNRISTPWIFQLSIIFSSQSSSWSSSRNPRQKVPHRTAWSWATEDNCSLRLRFIACMSWNLCKWSRVCDRASNSLEDYDESSQIKLKRPILLH